MTIHYITGDATNPLAKGPKIVAHICNDLGGWGKGFVLAISKKWPEPERDYRDWYHRRDGFRLGAVRYVRVRPDIVIANMIAQHGMKTGSNGPPIRYDALDTCLEDLSREATDQGATVHLPRIGTGLAGGRWNKIEQLLLKHFMTKDVFVYDLA